MKVRLIARAALAAALLPVCARGATYYIATGGSDSNSGSLASPFATFGKAIGAAGPGDTIYVRGGTYNLSSTVTISSGKVGKAAQPYTLSAYNGETPILDFTGAPSGSRGIQLNGNYWNLVGLTVQHAHDNGVNIIGSNNTIDRFRITANQDSGLQLSGSAPLTPANNLILNTDSWANYDPANHGENADGFAAKLRDLGAGNVFRGCRAWGNSDDGWDFWAAANGVTVENSWSFKNGFNNFGDTAWAGDGNGFKLGHDSGTHVLKNVVAWGNRLNGIDVNGNATQLEYPAQPITHGVTVYNATAYNNGAGGNGYNFNFDENFAHVLRNNISFQSGLGGSAGANIFADVDDASNTWNGRLAATGDFLSLNDSVAIGPRQADGSLPSTTFLHLASTSSLVNAGVDVGIAYNGSAPDLGAFETAAAPEPATLLLAGPALLLLLASRRPRR